MTALAFLALGCTFAPCHAQQMTASTKCMIAFWIDDWPVALKECRLAADQGDALAQFRLGLMYSNGQGVPQDYKEAVKWYRLAADQGEAKAQLNLGVMYHNGSGVSQDYAQAHKWFNLAGTSSDQKDAKTAAELRDLVARKMTTEQIAEAQKLASEWKPKTK